MRKVLLWLLIASLLLGLCACTTHEESDGLQLVAASFVPYDILRAVVGEVEGIQVTMLLAPGQEAHGFEPTPKDMARVVECDLFCHVGGESETWIERMLDMRKGQVLTLWDEVELLEAETVEGMQEEHDHDHEHPEEKDFDEHVWLDPLRMIEMTESCAEALGALDPAHAESYLENAQAYCKELADLDRDLSTLRQEAVRNTVVFADRFPARYFADRYDLIYYAAFPGCSTQTEASAATVAFLTDKVKQEAIPVVFKTEFSNGKMAETIREAAGCEIVSFHSAHNVTKEEWDAGMTYLDIMRGNLESLRKALCA